MFSTKKGSANCQFWKDRVPDDLRAGSLRGVRASLHRFWAPSRNKGGLTHAQLGVSTKLRGPACGLPDYEGPRPQIIRPKYYNINGFGPSSPSIWVLRPLGQQKDYSIWVSIFGPIAGNPHWNQEVSTRTVISEDPARPRQAILHCLWKI